MIPPLAVLGVATRLVVPLLVAAAVGYLVAGPAAVLGLLLGFLAGVVPAIAPLGAGWRAYAAGTTITAGVLGLGTTGAPVLAGVTVAGVALAAAPLSRRAIGAGTILPVVAAICASVDIEPRPLALAGGLLVGFGLVVLLARVLGVGAPVPGVPAATARRHAAALAGTAGPATAVVLAQSVPHGYWLVLALASALRPGRGESWIAARDRTAGTMLGVVVGVAGALLAGPATATIAAVALVVTVAWALQEAERLQAAGSAAIIVLATSSDYAGDVVGVAVDRLGLTALGAGVAVLAAWALERAGPDRAHPERGGPDRAGPNPAEPPRS